MGRLTTHVLDTARGKPAAGVAIELWWLGTEAEERYDQVLTVLTNADGRTDQPLLQGDALWQGRYALIFAVGGYFAAADETGLAVGDPPFLDLVPVRFGVSDPAAHYHIPLLVSPWAYSTYRGS